MSNAVEAIEAAKKAGFKNLAQVARISSVSYQTLQNWFINKPVLFEVVLKGCAEKVKEGKKGDLQDG